VNLPGRAYTFGWLLLGLGFATLEGLALADADPGDTLSEHVWWLLDLHPIAWWLALGLAAWAVRHFFFKKV